MSDKKITAAFDPKGIRVPIKNILPLKTLPDRIRDGVKYERIRASMQDVGIVEPLIVYPQKEQPGMFLLLDGYLRWDIAKQLGIEEADCLIATDDEAFTYNHKVSQLSAIQEHFMIEKAVKGGVSEERLAKALSIDVASIQMKRNLLDGICPEAVSLLKERRVSVAALRLLKQLKPMRQIDVAEMMIAANNITTSYVKCIVAATPVEHFVDEAKPKEIKGIDPSHMARMERELAALERDFKGVERNYGDNMLNLVVAVGYVRKLLDNAPVVRYLSRHHSDILAEFQRIIDSASLKASA